MHDPRGVIKEAKGLIIELKFLDDQSPAIVSVQLDVS
jgi:hypothetical protein